MTRITSLYLVHVSLSCVSDLWPLTGPLFHCVLYICSVFRCRSVFAESPLGSPGVCASRVAMPLLPVVFAFWWLRLAPRGCAVFVV